MRVVLQDLAVFASAWLAFVGVAHQIFLAWKLAGHEAPLQSRWETCATASSKAGLFNRGNDLVLSQAFAAVFA